MCQYLLEHVALFSNKILLKEISYFKKLLKKLNLIKRNFLITRSYWYPRELTLLYELYFDDDRDLHIG